jgi:hypothetical protein
MAKITNPIELEDHSSISENPSNGNFLLFFKNGILTKRNSSGAESVVAESSGSTLNNIVWVNSVSDLPTPSGGTHTLLANTLYFFNIGTFNLSDTLTLGNNTQIYGINKTATIINYSGVGNLINATNCNFTLRDIELQASSGTVFNVSNTTSQSMYCEQINFRNCNSLGTINGGGIFWKYTLNMSGGNGLLLSGTLGSCIFDTCSFRTLSGGSNSYSIQVANGSSGISFRCYKNIIDSASTHYGIWINGTFTLSSGGILQGNVFNGVGTRLSGINGISTGWEILHKNNHGIAGYQQVIIDMINTADSSITTNYPSFVALTQRCTVLNVTDYDQFATTIRVTAIVRAQTTNGSNFYSGLVDRDSVTLITGSDGITVGTGNMIINKSTPIVIGDNKTLSIAVARTSGQSTTVRSVQILLEIY